VTAATTATPYATRSPGCTWPTRSPRRRRSTRLRRKDAIDEDEAEHGEEEHAEGHEVLLAVLESGELDGDEFDDLVEELAKVVNHHLTEEELTILNPAGDDVAEDSRRALGEAFAARRNELLDGGAGTLEDVRRIVAQAREDGLI
jgi:hypothetical protein